MEWVIQSSLFYSFYLFLSILPCNVDRALVFLNFELYSNVRTIFECSSLYSNVEEMCF